MTPSNHKPHRTRARLRAALLALVAIAAVTAPTAGANRNAPITTSLELELNIYDAHLSQACDTEVVAVLSGLLQKKVVVGKTSVRDPHVPRADHLDRPELGGDVLVCAREQDAGRLPGGHRALQARSRHRHRQSRRHLPDRRRPGRAWHARVRRVRLRGRRRRLPVLGRPGRPDVDEGRLRQDGRADLRSADLTRRTSSSLRKAGRSARPSRV